VIHQYTVVPNQLSQELIPFLSFILLLYCHKYLNSRPITRVHTCRVDGWNGRLQLYLALCCFFNDHVVSDAELSEVVYFVLHFGRYLVYDQPPDFAVNAVSVAVDVLHENNCIWLELNQTLKNAFAEKQIELKTQGKRKPELLFEVVGLVFGEGGGRNGVLTLVQINLNELQIIGLGTKETLCLLQKQRVEGVASSRHLQEG